MRIRLLDTVDRMDLRDDDIGERPFILDADEDENIRTAEAGMSLFHTAYAFQRADHVFGLSRFHFDENVGSCRHGSLLLSTMGDGECSMQHDRLMNRRSRHRLSMVGIDLFKILPSRCERRPAVSYELHESPEIID